VNRINLHNRVRADKAGWTMGMNQFGDLTAAEFRAKMLQRKGTITRASEPQFATPQASQVGNSSYVNWYKQGVVLDVRNQVGFFFLSPLFLSFFLSFFFFFDSRPKSISFFFFFFLFFFFFSFFFR
jgi:hypothetical protein